MNPETEHEQEPTEEVEINPRTGLPYKQSKKLREQKMKWRNNNPDVVIKHIRKWQDNNRAKMYASQVEYARRKREEHKYLLELFKESVAVEIGA